MNKSRDRTASASESRACVNQLFRQFHFIFVAVTVKCTADPAKLTGFNSIWQTHASLGDFSHQLYYVVALSLRCESRRGKLDFSEAFYCYDH